MNDKGDCRSAPATPGLLIRYQPIPWYRTKGITTPSRKELQGQSCRTGTMHFLECELELLASDVFYQISLNLYVCHITHLIVGNLNFFEKIQFTTFSININVPPSRTQKSSFILPQFSKKYSKGLILVFNKWHILY